MFKFTDRLKTKHLILVLAGSFTVSAFLYFSRTTQNSIPETSTSQGVTDAATLIPEGYVLVPIELSNQASLQSLIGGFAVVDLFVPGTAGQPRGRKVGKSLRLIRAPLNPDQFAVLVREHQVASIMESQLPLFAVIQNSRSNSESQVSSRTSQESITYFEGTEQ